MKIKKKRNPSSKIHYYKTYGIAMLFTSMAFCGIFGYMTIMNFVRPIVSTSSYHFNVQYRAGNDTAMSEVVNNSLFPLLEMYDRHPNWKANIEFQGLMLDWMEKVNPECLSLLKKLTDRDQIQLICVQYSSALALAYPYIDFYKSVNYTQHVLREKAIVNETDADSVSRAVLLQEGQFMLGACKLVKDFTHANGTPIYDTFMTTKESLSYYKAPVDAPLYTYELNGHQCYILPYYLTAVEAGVLHNILWFQDGENVNTGSGETWEEGGLVTFNGTFFEENPERMRNHERRLMDLEKQGNIFMTLDEWIQYLIDKDAAKPLTQYVPETHWAAFRYRGSFIWMAEYSGSSAYDDGEVNAKNYRTHQYLQATEILLNYSMAQPSTNISGTLADDLLANMTKAWMDLAEAQVTDSTGLSPRYFEGETAIVKTNWAVENATIIQDTVINLTTVLNETINNLQPIQINPSSYDPWKNWSVQPWDEIVMTNASEFIKAVDLGAANPLDITHSPFPVNNYTAEYRLKRLEDMHDPLLDDLEFFDVSFKFNPVLESHDLSKSRYWSFSNPSDGDVSFEVSGARGMKKGFLNDSDASAGGMARFEFTYPSPYHVKGNFTVGWKMNVSSGDGFNASILNKIDGNTYRNIIQLHFGSAGSLSVNENGSWTSLGPALWTSGSEIPVSIHAVNDTHSWFKVGGLIIDNGGSYFENQNTFANNQQFFELSTGTGDTPQVYIDDLNASWRWDVTSNVEDDFEYLIIGDENPWAHVTFSGDFQTIEYSMTLWEKQTISLDRSDYYPDTYNKYGDWEERTKIDNFDLYIPLSNGLVYLDNTNTAVIKNCSGAHVCVKWNPSELRFMQTRTFNRLNTTWQFFILENVTRQEAISFANLVNTNAAVNITR
ncbi:hypothetical protein GF325_14275 [Candidatus Bathyarchaeota archaeon]|nr:hypothetical protein [Candidatus Bathyarchaeota archaeon]